MSWLLMVFFMRTHCQTWPKLNSLFSLLLHSFSIFLLGKVSISPALELYLHFLSHFTYGPNPAVFFWVNSFFKPIPAPGFPELQQIPQTNLKSTATSSLTLFWPPPLKEWCGAGLGQREKAGTALVGFDGSGTGVYWAIRGCLHHSQEVGNAMFLGSGCSSAHVLVHSCIRVRSL